jgi:hypothetical protein
MNKEEIKAALVPGARFRCTGVTGGPDNSDKTIKVVLGRKEEGDQSMILMADENTEEGREFGTVNINTMQQTVVPQAEQYIVDEGPGKWGVKNPNNEDAVMHFELLDSVPLDEQVELTGKQKKRAKKAVKRAVAEFEARRLAKAIEQVLRDLIARRGMEVVNATGPGFSKPEAKPPVH